MNQEIKTIELNNKEKSALSLIYGLHLKFSKEALNNPKTYTSDDLKRMFQNLRNKINKDELDLLTLSKEIQFNSPMWKEINEQIEKSNIARYDWQKVFGRTLTKEILYLIKEGYSYEESFKHLLQDQRVINFIRDNIHEKERIIEKIKISVSARYGENKTAKKVREEDGK